MCHGRLYQGGAFDPVDRAEVREELFNILGWIGSLCLMVCLLIVAAAYDCDVSALAGRR